MLEQVNDFAASPEIDRCLLVDILDVLFCLTPHIILERQWNFLLLVWALYPVVLRGCFSGNLGLNRQLVSNIAETLLFLTLWAISSVGVSAF